MLGAAAACAFAFLARLAAGCSCSSRSAHLHSRIRYCDDIFKASDFNKPIHIRMLTVWRLISQAHLGGALSAGLSRHARLALHASLL